jgi:hypothetical protein
MGHGDRFRYHLDYVARTQQLVTRQLGRTIGETVFTAAPGTGWLGPMRSAYGHHLVLIEERVAERTPPLDAIRDHVRDDTRSAGVARATAAAIERIIDGYDVRILVPGLDSNVLVEPATPQ